MFLDREDCVLVSISSKLTAFGFLFLGSGTRTRFFITQQIFFRLNSLAEQQALDFHFSHFPLFPHLVATICCRFIVPGPRDVGSSGRVKNFVLAMVTVYAAERSQTKWSRVYRALAAAETQA